MDRSTGAAMKFWDRVMSADRKHRDRMQDNIENRDAIDEGIADALEGVGNMLDGRGKKRRRWW